MLTKNYSQKAVVNGFGDATIETYCLRCTDRHQLPKVIHKCIAANIGNEVIPAMQTHEKNHHSSQNN